MKIQDREHTNIIPSLVAIEKILAHESTPWPSLFKLLLDEINFINTSQGMIGYGLIFANKLKLKINGEKSQHREHKPLLCLPP